MPQLTPHHIVETLQSDAAGRTGTDPSQWVICAERAVQWTDTSLGLREPGHMYARIMVPGYRVVLRDVSGTREMVYHAGFSGSYKFSREQPVVADRELG